MRFRFLARRIGALSASVATVALLSGGAGQASAADCDRDTIGPGKPFTLWEFDEDGQFSEATMFLDAGPESERGDAFDDYGVVSLDGTEYENPNDAGCVRKAKGHDIAFPADDVNGVIVKPQLYIGQRKPFGRQFVSLRNPGPGPVTMDFAWDGDLGSNGSTVVGTSTSNDSSMNQGDRWGSTCEDDDSDGCGDAAGESSRDPELAHNWEGKGKKKHSADLVFDPELNDGDVLFQFDDVTIGAGKTVTFMQIVSLATSIKAANRAARAIDRKPTRYGVFAGLSKQERKRLQNW